MTPNLAKRAYKIIDQLMPGLKLISIPDYGELNDVLIALGKASVPEADPYLKALSDFEELLDNAASNHTGSDAPRHWDYELRDQLIVLRDQYNQGT